MPNAKDNSSDNSRGSTTDKATDNATGKANQNGDRGARLLAIESATDSLSIALFAGDELLLLKESAETRQHASVLLPLIDEAFREVDWSAQSVEALAVSSGPGSFTSLRIGLATAKGLAFGRDVQVIGVSTLEAMAVGAVQAGRGQGGSADVGRDSAMIVTLLDARRGEWYACGWTSGDGLSVTPSLPEGLYSPEHLVADLGEPVVVVCPETHWRPEFEAAGLEVAQVIEGPTARPRADWVGRLGAQGLARGEGGAARDLAARYLRRAEAEATRLGGPVEAGELARVADRGQGA